MTLLHICLVPRGGSGLTFDEEKSGTTTIRPAPDSPDFRLLSGLLDAEESRLVSAGATGDAVGAGGTGAAEQPATAHIRRPFRSTEESDSAGGRPPRHAHIHRMHTYTHTHIHTHTHTHTHTGAGSS